MGQMISTLQDISNLQRNRQIAMLFSGENIQLNENCYAPSFSIEWTARRCVCAFAVDRVPVTLPKRWYPDTRFLLGKIEFLFLSSISIVSRSDTRDMGIEAHRVVEFDCADHMLRLATGAFRIEAAVDGVTVHDLVPVTTYGVEHIGRTIGTL